MKNKRLITVLLGISAVALLAAGCAKADSGSKDSSSDGKANEASKEDTTIRVGASVTPHAEILKEIEGNLKDKGYTLEIIEYNDYVLPNTALEDGDLDANYFQHKPYLDDFNKEQGTHLVSAASVHFEPFGIYAGKTASLDDLKEGAIVAVPNDTTNEARALLLLEAQGLIKLKEDVGIGATAVDIVENPLNLQIKELEAAQVAKALQDVDIACINGNYASEAGLSMSEALAVEAADSLAAETYANIIAVKEGNEDTAKTKALVEAILSDNVKEYINDNYKGAVVPVF
jgi:D-methionine transport system substrate-binding protein